MLSLLNYLYMSKIECCLLFLNHTTIMPLLSYLNANTKMKDYQDMKVLYVNYIMVVKAVRKLM